jgi:uncharacterized protein (DUF849 family)
MVAPNGARLSKQDHPALPVTIPEIVATAVACQKAGADGLHAHVRDKDGAHVLDAGLYAELLSELARAAPGLYVQITTEAAGRYSPADQRALVDTLRPYAVSIALREITAEPDGGITAGFFAACAEAGTEVQHILYDTDDVRMLARLVTEGIVPDEDLAVLHVLGRYSQGQTSDPSAIPTLLASQKAAGLTPDWALCAFGPTETECLLSALQGGGKARIGFENNMRNRDGSIAADNAERVGNLLSLDKSAGNRRADLTRKPSGA